MIHCVTEFPIIELGPDLRRESIEPLGSKRKFWFRHTDETRWLFKYSRPNTGEHWAEKLGAEIASILDLPHARVELAVHDGAWGSISRDFTNEARYGLVHGNELLTEQDPEYPAASAYRVREHTVEAVRGVLQQDFISAPASAHVPASFTPFDVFVGYLLLDAVLGNTDRHHENWGILLTASSPRRAELAPTYDHASSLGRELSDHARGRKYSGPDGIHRYLAKARSALFAAPDAALPLSPIEAFRTAARSAAPAGEYWLGKLRKRRDSVRASLASMPVRAMEAGARAFCDGLLSANLQSLLD